MRRTLGLVPESDDRFGIFENCDDESVLLVSVRHEQERIVVDVAEEFDSRSVIPTRQSHERRRSERE